MFDCLSNSGLNTATVGNETTTDDDMHLSDNTTNDQSAESAAALQDGAVELSNQTSLPLSGNTTHNASMPWSNDLEDLDTKQTQLSDPIIELEELDLSFNDIGGHGARAMGLDLVNSARFLFERGFNCRITNTALLVPRVLAMENCGIGPAFCRSIGRVSFSTFRSMPLDDKRSFSGRLIVCR